MAGFSGSCARCGQTFSTQVRLGTPGMRNIVLADLERQHQCSGKLRVVEHEVLGLFETASDREIDHANQEDYQKQARRGR